MRSSWTLKILFLISILGVPLHPWGMSGQKRQISKFFFRKPKMGGPLQNISCNVSIISQHHAIQRCILRCCKSQGHNPLVSIHQPVAWTTLVHFWTTIVQLLHGFVKVIYLFSKVVSCILSQYCQKQVKTRQMKLKLLIDLNQTTPLDLLCFWNSFFLDQLVNNQTPLAKFWYYWQSRRLGQPV